MKGVIALALRELVISKFGPEKWKAALKHAGVDDEPLILAISDLDDGLVFRMVQGVCRSLNLTLAQAADVFGDYWVNNYAQKMYSSYFVRSQTAREFLLSMDEVHQAMTKRMPGAHPPRFDYEWKDERTLLIRYHSQRGMFDFMAGLVKGVGKYYRTDLKVIKKADDLLEVIFP